VRVPAEVAGRVLLRPEDEHPAVKAGEVVVTLDAALIRAATRAAQAAARRAKARHEYAQLELARVKKLYERKSIGEADLDQADVAAHQFVHRVRTRGTMTPSRRPSATSLRLRGSRWCAFDSPDAEYVLYQCPGSRRRFTPVARVTGALPGYVGATPSGCFQ